MTIAEIIKVALKAKGCNQRQLAAEIGYGEGMICKWAKGKTRPTFQTVEEICVAADLRIAILDKDGKEVVYGENE